VLIGVEDVAPGIGKEAADGGDQPGSVGAGEEQSRGEGWAVDGGIIALEAQDRVQLFNSEFAICA